MQKNGGILRSGFRRYLFSIQYHGSAFLGFSLQRDENCILSNGTDLRGYVSVERRIRLALSALLVGNDSEIEPSDDSFYENIQVSSRTDRGVHAIKNTFHVDIRIPGDHSANSININNPICCRRKHLLQAPERILRGINFYLKKTSPTSATDGLDEFFIDDMHRSKVDTQHFCGGEWVRRSPMDEVRILGVKEAPLYMDNSMGHLMYHQDPIIDWNARFSAFSRTYVYRIFHTIREPDWAVPFEWDRSWHINDEQPLDIAAMKEAAAHLMGTHDFSSFRGSGCTRQSPITTISDISINVEPLSGNQYFMDRSAPRSFDSALDMISNTEPPSKLCCVVTIRYQGSAFLYRQVRRMTGCLVAVGRRKVLPKTVRDFLQLRNSEHVPYSAPPQGLFLVNVEHEGIVI